jgi:hypothetical protein
MKKSMLFWSFVVLALFPAYLFAQDIQLPTIEIRAGQDKVPARVKDALLNDFGEGHKPFVWVTNNSLFRMNNWEQSSGVENKEIYSYSIRTKTSTGSTLDALYTQDGKLISSREYLKNFKPSQNVLLALQNSEFKDWGIKKNFHLIKSSSNGIEKERYALEMIKGKDKKTVRFDAKSGILAVVPGELKELADLDW